MNATERQGKVRFEVFPFKFVTHEIIFGGYFQSRKNSFFFYWIKLNSNILPYVFVKKIQKSLKHPS